MLPCRDYTMYRDLEGTVNKVFKCISSCVFIRLPQVIWGLR